MSSRFSYKDFNNAISEYLSGNREKLVRFLENDQNHYIDKSAPIDLELTRNIKKYVFYNHGLNKELKAAMISSLKNREPLNITATDIISNLGLCEENRCLTEKGIIKAISLLPNAKEQFNYVKQYFEDSVKMFYISESEPFEKPIESFYANFYRSRGYVVPNPELALPELIGGTFIYIAEETLLSSGIYDQFIVESKSLTPDRGPTRKFSLNMSDFVYARHLDDAKKKKLIEYNEDLKLASMSLLDECDFVFFETKFHESCEISASHNLLKGRVSDYIDGLREIVKSGNWDAMKKLAKSRIENETFINGWPDLTAFRDGSVELFEIKSKRDKLRIDQIIVFRAVSSLFYESVKKISLVHNTN